MLVPISVFFSGFSENLSHTHTYTYKLTCQFLYGLFVHQFSSVQWLSHVRLFATP